MSDDSLVEQIGRIIASLELQGDYLGDDFRTQTPVRVANMLTTVFREAATDPASALSRRIAYTGEAQTVSVQEIKFYSMCEHHFLPFWGEIQLSYIPNEYIIGFRSLFRLVEILTKRPQLQERLTDELANHIQAGLEPQGTAVHVRAKHLCSLMVSNEHEDFTFETTSFRGVFNDNPIYQQNFISRITARMP